MENMMNLDICFAAEYCKTMEWMGNLVHCHASSLICSDQQFTSGIFQNLCIRSQVRSSDP